MRCAWLQLPLLWAATCHGQDVEVVGGIPRVIWSFWDGDAIPDLVQRCLASWRRRAAAWQVRLLNRKTALGWLGYDQEPTYWLGLSPAGLSDLIRTEVVAAYGGVWLDATIALQEPPEAWIQHGTDGESLLGFDMDFAALTARRVSPLGREWALHFHRNGSLRAHFWQGDGKARYFESWAFAAPPNCPALRAWRDELRRAAERGFTAYCADIMTEPAAAEYLHPALRDWLPYLVIHATLARVRHQQPTLAVRTLPAESTGLAHSNYVVDWALAYVAGQTDFAMDGTGGSVFALARHPDEDPPPPRVGPLVKLRSLERVAFDCIVFYQAHAASSPLAQLLALEGPKPWFPLKAARFLAVLEARFGPTNDKALLILFWFVRRAVSRPGGVLAAFLTLALVAGRVCQRQRKKKED